MSVISALFDNRVYSFEHAFGVNDITSDEMKHNIQLWFELYFAVETTKCTDECQRLPVTIVNKLSKTVFSEYKAEIQTKGAKAEFMTGLVGRVNGIKQAVLQQALVGGECFIKPVLTAQGFQFSIVRRDCFIPLARDVTGAITSVGTADVTTVGKWYYTLLERRTANPDESLTIESKLFSSQDRGNLGSEVPLSTLEKYANIEPVLVLPGVGNVGMARVKTPLLNCVDGSQDGVSVYAPAVGLIQNINRNEQQLNKEFENGASRIIASEDFLKLDKDGNRRLEDDLFMGMDEDPGEIGITIFSPALREASYLARKQEYLRNIESQIGLKRGILSEVEAAERTATEITSSAGDYNLTIIDFQNMWESALRELLTTCDKLGQLYKLCDTSPFNAQDDLTIEWGDGVLFNREKVWQEYKEMVAGDLLKPELALAWYFRLPTPKNERDLQKIRQDYMPELEAMVGGDEADGDE